MPIKQTVELDHLQTLHTAIAQHFLILRNCG